MNSKRFTVWGNLLAVALIFFAAMFVAALCLIAMRTVAPRMEQTTVNTIVYAIHFVCAIVGAALYYRSRGAGKPLFRFGLDFMDAPLTLFGIFLVAAAGIVFEPLFNLFPESYFESMGEMTGSGGVAILFTVVLAPVCEELFFRGLVLEQTSRRWNALTAVVVSALFFGVVHLPNLLQMVNAFVMGIVMGYIYILTRSLVPVITIHAVNNAVAYLGLQMDDGKMTDTREMIGNETLYLVVYAVSAVILVGSVVWMVMKARNKTGEMSLHENNE